MKITWLHISNTADIRLCIATVRMYGTAPTTLTCLNPHSEIKAYAICCQISLLFGILLNSALLFGLIKDPLRCFRNCSSYLIMNNTFSDLVLCCYKLAKYYWRECSDGLIVSRVFTAPLYISFLSIFFLALDRCFLVCRPFKYRAFARNGKKAAAVIIFEWLFAFLNIAVVKKLETFLSGFRLLSGIFMLVCSCLFYAKTIYHLKKEARNLESKIGSGGETTMEARKQSLRKETRFVHTIMYITFLFVLTLSPLLIFDVVNENHGYGDIVKERVHMCLYFLFYSNFVINSLVYYCRLTNYRKTFRLLFCSYCSKPLSRWWKIHGRINNANDWQCL